MTSGITWRQVQEAERVMTAYNEMVAGLAMRYSCDENSPARRQSCWLAAESDIREQLRVEHAARQERITSVYRSRVAAGVAR